MKSKKGPYQISGFPDVSHLVSFTSPISSFYQSLGTGLLETLIRFETVSSMPGLTKSAKGFIETNYQAAYKFIENFPQRQNDVTNFYALYQILISPDYQVQEKHTSLNHYLENDPEYASALDYGTRVLICMIFAGKVPKQTEIMSGQDRDINGIIQGFAETFKLKIVLIDQNCQNQEFCSSIAGNYPMLYIFTANTNFYLCYTKPMIEIETNPQLIEEKIRNPGLVHVKKNEFIREQKVLAQPGKPTVFPQFNGNFSNQGDRRVSPQPERPAPFPQFNGNFSKPVVPNPVPDTNLSRNEAKIMQFLPVQVMVLIEKMALIINRNNIFDSVTIESAKTAFDACPQLKNIEALKSLIQMPQPQNEPVKNQNFAGGNANFNGFDGFPRFPEANNRRTEEFDRANAYRPVVQQKFAAEDQVACQRCREMKDKSIYSNLACPENCILCPLCRNTNKLQCIKCQRHYSNNEKDFLPILVESLAVKR